MLLQQKEAIVKLLGDDDPFTVNLVKEQLISRGGEARPELLKFLEEKDHNVRDRVVEILAEIDSNEACAELSILCPLFPEEGDIEYASWLLARAILPGIEVEKYQRAIDNYGRDLSALIQETMTPQERIGVIASFLNKKHGFRGNPGDYYDAGNSLLPRIIDSRRGIPISLTLLYMLAGARAGIKIEGVNLPGHFLAKHDGILFDPYEQGRIMTLADCNAILARQNLTFSPDHFEIAGPRVMFRRMLTNLLYIYQNNGAELQAQRLAEWVNGLDRS